MVDSNPTQTAEQRRRELINSVFTDINPYIKNMMYVLADNRHISLEPTYSRRSKAYITDTTIKILQQLSQHMN